MGLDDIVEDIFDVGFDTFGGRKKDYYTPCPKCGGKFKYKKDKGIYKCKNCGYWAYPQQQHAPPPAPAPQPVPAPAPVQKPKKKGKPEILIDIVAEEPIHINKWDQFDLKIINRGNVDIENIDLKFDGPLEIHGHYCVTQLAAGETRKLSIGLKATELGRIPVTISAKFETVYGDKHSHRNMDWITVIEDRKETQVSPQVINIGRIDSSTKISDSVLTKSDVGRGGGGSRGGSITVSDSVVTGSNIGIGGGSDDGVEWADSRKTNCPNCSAAIKPGWKACPNCGTMF